MPRLAAGLASSDFQKNRVSRRREQFLTALTNYQPRTALNCLSAFNKETVMQDLESLRTRVDQTADKLAIAETERRDQTSSLVNMLQRLEEKYTSQEVELNYYRERIQPMEAANGELAKLMDKLLDLIDTGFDEGSMGSLQDAAKLATDMLGSDLLEPADEEPQEAAAEAVAEEEAAAEAVAEEEAAEEEVQEAPTVAEAVPEEEVIATAEDIVDEVDDEVVEEADDGTVVQFENVSEAALAFELAEDAPDGMDDYPVVVHMAADMAVDDGLVRRTDELAPDIEMSAVAEEIAAAVNADVSPEESRDSEVDNNSANDIRALLARVEALAAKAELMREPEIDNLAAGSDEPIDSDDFDEAPRKTGSAG
jgi:hypothetical protein